MDHFMDHFMEHFILDRVHTTTSVMENKRKCQDDS